MGRSVNYLSNSLHVAYIYLQTDSSEEFETQMEWNDLEDSLYDLLEEYPSLDLLKGNNKGWEGREVSIIAENCHCEIGLSEYCGLVSVSIRVNDTNFRCMPQLAENWINRMWPKFQAKLDKQFNTLSRIGTFSNGEGVYEKKSA